MPQHSAPIDTLCDIITHLSQNPRPPRSAEELQAARYIEQKLNAYGVEDVQEQVFHAVGKLSDRLGTAGVLAGVGMLVGAGQARWRRVAGTLLMLSAAMSAHKILQGQAPPWETIFPQRRSQNIMGRIPARETAQERVVLLAHMDTDMTRLRHNPKLRDYAPYLFAGLPQTALFGSLLTLFGAPIWMRQLVAATLFGEAGLSVVDDMGTSTTGANDNASGVAMLLALGGQLTQNPLQKTEVVLNFTGCGTVAGQGSAEIVKEFGDQWQDAWWLSLDNIGAGELCWVSSHGLSKTDRYEPHSEVVERLSRIAHNNPTLGIMGRSMTTLDDVGPLRAKNMKAAGLMGYDRASGHPKSWDAEADAPNTVQPETLTRTWEYMWAILRDIDGE